jgi:porphobilinogen deaminase
MTNRERENKPALGIRQNMTTEEMRDFLLQNNFMRVRQLEDGSWIGTMKLMFTTSVCMDIDELSPSAIAGASRTRRKRITSSIRQSTLTKFRLVERH